MRGIGSGNWGDAITPKGPRRCRIASTRALIALSPCSPPSSSPNRPKRCAGHLRQGSTGSDGRWRPGSAPSWADRSVPIWAGPIWCAQRASAATHGRARCWLTPPSRRPSKKLRPLLRAVATAFPQASLAADHHGARQSPFRHARRPRRRAGQTLCRPPGACGLDPLHDALPLVAAACQKATRP